MYLWNFCSTPPAISLKTRTKSIDVLLKPKKEEPKKEEPKEEPKEDYNTISQELQRLIVIKPIDKIIKALNEMNIKGKLQTRKILLVQQILQNLKSIEMMKKLINLLKE